MLKFKPRYMSGLSHKENKNDRIRYFEARNGYIIAINNLPNNQHTFSVYKTFKAFLNHTPIHVSATISEAKRFCYELEEMTLPEETILDTEKLAESIYDASIDLDFCDYADTRENDIKSLENALTALLRSNDPDNAALLEALKRIHL